LAGESAAEKTGFGAGVVVDGDVEESFEQPAAMTATARARTGKRFIV
jgi:hypothetical protein